MLKAMSMGIWMKKATASQRIMASHQNRPWLLGSRIQTGRLSGTMYPVTAPLSYVQIILALTSNLH